MMDDTQRQNLLKYSGLLLVFVLCFMFWFGVFQAVTNPNRDGGTKSDKLSGEDYSMGAVNSDRGPNPNTPYFVGFDYLKTYGVADDDRRYIKDFITNYVLYQKHLAFAKVSYVNETFKAPSEGTLDVKYSFDFGINGSDVHRLVATSNIVTQKIDLSILDGSNKQVAHKSFDIVSG